jgi:hypothetical protein
MLYIEKNYKLPKTNIMLFASKLFLKYSLTWANDHPPMATTILQQKLFLSPVFLIHNSEQRTTSQQRP